MVRERRRKGRKRRERRLGRGEMTKDPKLGITQYKEHCSENVDWENPTVLATLSGKNKKRLAYDLKVREALEIKRNNCGPGSGLNKDTGAYVKTSQCNPVFYSMAMT